MLPTEVDFPHLSQMNKSLDWSDLKTPDPKTFQENHLLATYEFLQAIRLLYHFLRKDPFGETFPVRRISPTELKWFVRNRLQGCIYVKADTASDDRAEVIHYPTDNFVHDIGISIFNTLSSNPDLPQHPLVDIIQTRYFPISSFTGSSRTKEELLIVKKALTIPMNLRRWKLAARDQDLKTEGNTPINQVLAPY